MNEDSYITIRNKETVWICPNHIPPIVHSINVMKCYMSYCTSQRPETKKSLKVSITKSEHIEELPQQELCQNLGCQNTRIEGRKYCSDNCRKDRARKKYRQKKRLEKSNRQCIDK